MPQDSCIIMLCQQFLDVLLHITLNYVWDLTFDPRAKPGVVNWIWQIMAACSCNPSIQQAKMNWTCHCMCLGISFWNCNHFEYANEVIRQYFQQAVLLHLLRALYHAGICSYATCNILCPKLCWHNSPMPIKYASDLWPPQTSKHKYGITRQR